VGIERQTVLNAILIGAVCMLFAIRCSARSPTGWGGGRSTCSALP